MAEWVGALGGLLMLVLITVLLFRFLEETELLARTRTLRAYLAEACVLGCGQLLLGGLWCYARSSVRTPADVFTAWQISGSVGSPWSLYLSLAAGCLACALVAESIHRRFGRDLAHLILSCLLVFPGSWSLFLPSPIPFAALAVAALTNLLLAKCPKRELMIPDVFPVSLIPALLAAANGVTIILHVGG